MRVVRRAARAILIDDDGRLVTFKRTVPRRKVYWSTPGGGVDPEDSSIEAALHRELAEELGAVVDRAQQVFLASPPRRDGIAIQHFFVCHLVSMNLKARTGAEFSNPAKGRYDVERIDLRGKKLARYDLQPREARDFILANRQALLAAALDDDVPPLTDPAQAPTRAPAADLVEPGAAIIAETDTPSSEDTAPVPDVTADAPSTPTPPVVDVAPRDGAPQPVQNDAGTQGAGTTRIPWIVEQRTALRRSGRPASQSLELLELVTTSAGSSTGESPRTTATTPEWEKPRQPQRRSFFRRRRR